MFDERTPICVVVIDDDLTQLRSWREILSDERYHVTLISDPQEAMTSILSLAVDVVIVDIRMPGINGLELLSVIRKEAPTVEIVMMADRDGVADAATAIRRGAYDFLMKPVERNEATETIVRRAAEFRRLERRTGNSQSQPRSAATRSIIGQSEAIQGIIDLIRSVSLSPATVLISGESGTGKELVARAIHEASARAEKPLITVNCSALNDSLLESELFGHVKGAFTGATNSHPGLFQAADGGTIFLDEIADMAPQTQVKLLRTLQEGEVRAVGATRPVIVDVRVIAATNKDLAAEARAGRFREDLYYRLNVVCIQMPPLRSRGQDIRLLAAHLLDKYQTKMAKRFDGFDQDALTAMGNYPWPGNVRQLENAIEQAVVLAQGATIRLRDLPADIAGQKARLEQENVLNLSFAEAKSRVVQRFEQTYLGALLAQHDTIAAAARAAGLDRSNFKRLLRRHGLAVQREIFRGTPQ